MSQTFVSHNLTDTTRLAVELADRIQPGTVILLEGDLGSGKTALTQLILKELGVTDRIQSPTFTLLREYKGTKFPHTIFHFDLYRIQDEAELKSIELAEILDENKHLVIIEWPKRIDFPYAQKVLHIQIKVQPDDSREFRIHAS